MISRVPLAALLASAACAEPSAPARSLFPSYVSKLVPEAPQMMSSFSSEQPSQSIAAPGLIAGPGLLDAASGGVEGVTEESSEIVQGIVEAFFHRQSLQPGEAACLSQGAGKLAGDTTAMAANLFLLLEQALGKAPHRISSSPGSGAGYHDQASDISSMVDGMVTDVGQSASAGAAPVKAEVKVQQEAQQHAAQEARADLDFFTQRRLNVNAKLMRMAPGMVMQFGMAFQKMVTISHQIAKECLHEDALAALKRSGKHLQSAQYIGGHIMANGQDIVEELADATIAYKAHNFRKFGQDFGTAMRKVFLCDADGSGLPEGKPDEEVVANVTEGLLQGFFGQGSELILKLPGDGHIPIDLHQCISNNLGFFTSVWSEVMYLYAKKVSGTKTKEQLQWSTAVAFTMMQLPKALERCNLGGEEQQMLQDAITGLASGNQGLGYHLRLPRTTPVSNDQLEQHLAVTVKAWAEKRWTTFGEDMGRLLQEMVITVFAKKYSVGTTGLLQRNALWKEAAPRASTGPYLALCAACAAVFGLAVTRRVVATGGNWHDEAGSDGTDQEAAE